METVEDSPVKQELVQKINNINQQQKMEDIKPTNGSCLIIGSENQSEQIQLNNLVDDGEHQVIIRDETIGQQSQVLPNVVTSTQQSPDQLNDLQSYLVTFNKEIGHGGPAGLTIAELDGSNLSNATQVIYSDGQLLNVVSSIPANQELSASDDTKVEIAMTIDSLDPQSQTLKLAESLAESTALLHQNDQIINQTELSTFSPTNEQQRTVMLQGLPGAARTLVQVELPGNRKIIPVVSIDGKEQMQLLDSVSTVVPQIIQVSQPPEAAQTGVEVMKTDIHTQGPSGSTGLGSLEGIQIGQADITNAQLIALQGTETTPQLVSVNSQQEIPVLGGTEHDQQATNFQTVSIVPTSGGDGGEMNYVLIVSQPDGDKEKQFALDMGMLQPVFDYKEGRDVIEEVVDEEGNTRKIIRVDPKKLEMLPTTLTQLQCHYCSYTAPKRYLLMRHMKTHSEDRPYQCNLCDKSFKTHASLQNHVNTHTGVRPHKCKDCEMAFTTSGELVRHIRYKHTFEKPHKCTECEYASVELSKLKRHMRSHTGERPYKCPHCAYASPDTYKLKRHLRIHTGEKPYECDVCHARFTQSNSLKAHKLIHSGLKPVFQCELCPTTCGRKTDLKIHMLKLHSNDKPVDCKKCGMCFQDRYSFKLHLKTHEGEKCFKCEQCDYAALSQRHLESHLLTHTGEKPFECDQCEQTFRQKQLLKRHKNLYHTPDYSRPEPKEKNYECNVCDKTFANKGNLLRHLQNHDPEYWNKEEKDGNVSLSTEDLIQGALLSDMREGKLGATPKVVIVHPNGSVEEVTSKLQSLVAEKQMEEMMVEVVQGGSNPSLEEAIRSQVEAAIQSHALKTLEIAKPNSIDDSAGNLTIDLDRPSQPGTSQPKQTYSRQELELGGSSAVTKQDNNSPGNSQASWANEQITTTPHHVVIIKPRHKEDVMNVIHDQSTQGLNESQVTGLLSDGNVLCTNLTDSTPILPDHTDHDMEIEDNSHS